MSSLKDTEKALNDIAGVTRDEIMEGLRNSLKDFDRRLPAPPNAIPGVQLSGASIQDVSAGFGLAVRKEETTPRFDPKGSFHAWATIDGVAVLKMFSVDG